MDAPSRLDDHMLRERALLDWASARFSPGRAGQVLAYLAASLGPQRRKGRREDWPAHPFAAVLRRDPAFSAQSPAQLMDILASDRPFPAAKDPGPAMLAAHRRLPHALAWRACREELGARLRRDWAEGRRICLLDPFLLHAGDGLEGADLSSLTVAGLAEEDAPARMRPRHLRPVTDSRAPPEFVAAALRSGERFDAVYAPGTCERLSDRSLAQLLALLADILRPGGKIILANLAPGAHPERWLAHLAGGTPYLRSGEQLAGLGSAQGLDAAVTSGAGGTVAFCRLRRSGGQLGR